MKTSSTWFSAPSDIDSLEALLISFPFSASLFIAVLLFSLPEPLIQLQMSSDRASCYKIACLVVLCVKSKQWCKFCPPVFRSFICMWQFSYFSDTVLSFFVSISSFHLEQNVCHSLIDEILFPVVFFVSKWFKK